MVDSTLMTGSESLGYGTQVSLDGASADPGALADVGLARKLLAELIGEVEPGICHEATVEAVVVAEDGADGHSAALVAGETSATLHVFTALRSVTLQLFTAHDAPLGRTTERFLGAFGVGRYQAGVRGRGLLLPRDPGQLERVLRGQREYARLRVVPSERVTL